jgi:hypothetical protein
MEGVKAQVGFTGTLQQFFEHIRTDPKFKPASREALQQGYVAIGKRLDATLPTMFSTIPKTPLEIRPVPALTEKGAARGSYQGGTADGSRPGIFYFNAYDLPSRTTPGMETLYLHEGAPGHHFQISLAQENEALPSFMRFGGNTAYVEGWGLYAETLGKRARSLYRPLPIFRLSRFAAVPGDPAGRRHRHPFQGLDPRPDHPVHPRQQLAREEQRHRRDRALHRHPRPGARLQDRPDEDQRASRPRGEGARPALRHTRIPRPGADDRRAAAGGAGEEDRRLDPSPVSND